MFNIGLLASIGGLNPAGGTATLPTYLEYIARDSGIDSTMLVTYGPDGLAYGAGSNLSWTSRPATYYWLDDPAFKDNFQLRATVMQSNAVSEFVGTGAWVPASTGLSAGIKRVRQSGVVTYAYLKIEVKRISTGVIEATSDVYLRIETV